MRRLVTICAVLGLILVPTCVSRAALTVNSPPGAPSWWNSATGLYAYGWWQAGILGGSSPVSPPNDSTHWASIYLNNTDFTASIGLSDQKVTLNLGNQLHEDLEKQIYVYMNGTTTSTTAQLYSSLDTDSGTFYGGSTWNISQGGTWNYVLSGVIIPQPEFTKLTLTVPGMTSVTNIWAGEDCTPVSVPVPPALLLGIFGLGAAGLKMRRLA
jgi:hypothetical protein